MCRILLVPPDQRGEGETEEEAVGGGSSAVAEPPASATQEVRIEMIQVCCFLALHARFNGPHLWT